MNAVLGIETSCDDTAAAVVIDGRLRASVVSSQRVHDAYGGVVPELASRDHQRLIVPVVRQALDQAGIAYGDLSGIAVTRGPGLAGALLVGVSMAKGLAWSLSVPLVGVNHLEGHLFSLYIAPPHPRRPFLCLVVSGGHTQLVLVNERFDYETLGRTRDDAAGEAFDKVGKLLGLPFPGGPEIDRLAPEGNPSFVAFPRTRLAGLDFSFSGIKTSVLYHLADRSAEAREQYLARRRADLAASFQQAVVDMLVAGVDAALDAHPVADLGVVGGVSANRGLRTALDALATRRGVRLFVPDPRYCTDNAAMIAVAGHHKLRTGHTSPLTLTADPALAL